MDDLMLFCKTKEHSKNIKSVFKGYLSIKELGDLNCCLEIEMHCKRDKRMIKMSQRAYIKQLAKKFGVENCNDVHTPAESNSKLMKMPDEENSRHSSLIASCLAH